METFSLHCLLLLVCIMDCSGEGSRLFGQQRSLFNLLISGRGDTRRSRLQLPWGDTVNIKYNRTLLGIPDFLVEGLGYAHLGSNHPLIPKVCAVSLEGSFYGVEVLLFYRGLPCTKRVAKRYVVQQYETRQSSAISGPQCNDNFSRLYRMPHNLYNVEKNLPQGTPFLQQNSTLTADQSILHPQPWTPPLGDYSNQVNFVEQQQSYLMDSNIPSDVTLVAEKSPKLYRSCVPPSSRSKRLKREEPHGVPFNQYGISHDGHPNKVMEDSGCEVVKQNPGPAAPNKDTGGSTLGPSQYKEDELECHLKSGEVESPKRDVTYETGCTPSYFGEEQKWDDFSLASKSRLWDHNSGSLLGLYPKSNTSDWKPMDTCEYSVPPRSVIMDHESLVHLGSSTTHPTLPHNPSDTFFKEDLLTSTIGQDQIYFGRTNGMCFEENKTHNVNNSLTGGITDASWSLEPFDTSLNPDVTHPELISWCLNKNPSSQESTSNRNVNETMKNITGESKEASKEISFMEASTMNDMYGTTDEFQFNTSSGTTHSNCKALTLCDTNGKNNVDLHATTPLYSSINPKSRYPTTSPEAGIERDTVVAQGAQSKRPETLQRTRLIVSCSTSEKSIEGHFGYHSSVPSARKRLKGSKKWKNASLSFYRLTSNSSLNGCMSDTPINQTHPCMSTIPYNYYSPSSYLSTPMNGAMPCTIQCEAFCPSMPHASLSRVSHQEDKCVEYAFQNLPPKTVSPFDTFSY